MLLPEYKKNSKCWTTAEQFAFLRDRYTEYHTIHESPKPKYETFWAQLNEAWFKVYPEINICFPDIASECDLDSDQLVELKKAVQKRIDVCTYTYFAVLFNFWASAN